MKRHFFLSVLLLSVPLMEACSGTSYSISGDSGAGGTWQALAAKPFVTGRASALALTAGSGNVWLAVSDAGQAGRGVLWRITVAAQELCSGAPFSSQGASDIGLLLDGTDGLGLVFADALYGGKGSTRHYKIATAAFDTSNVDQFTTGTLKWPSAIWPSGATPTLLYQDGGVPGSVSAGAAVLRRMDAGMHSWDLDSTLASSGVAQYPVLVAGGAAYYAAWADGGDNYRVTTRWHDGALLKNSGTVPTSGPVEALAVAFGSTGWYLGGFDKSAAGLAVWQHDFGSGTWSMLGGRIQSGSFDNVSVMLDVTGRVWVAARARSASDRLVLRYYDTTDNEWKNPGMVGLGSDPIDEAKLVADENGAPVLATITSTDGSVHLYRYVIPSSSSSSMSTSSTAMSSSDSAASASSTVSDSSSSVSASSASFSSSTASASSSAAPSSTSAGSSSASGSSSVPASSSAASSSASAVSSSSTASSSSGMSDADAVAADAAALAIIFSSGPPVDDATHVRGNLVLPLAGANGSIITWVSSDISYIDNVGTVTRPAYGSSSMPVTLTATITKNAASTPRLFSLVVLPASGWDDLFGGSWGVPETNIAMGFDGTTLYLAYSVTSGSPAGMFVQRYNGITWAIVGPATDNGAFGNPNANPIDMVVSGGVPYVAYSDAGFVGKATVQKFDGSAWAPLGSPGFTSETAESIGLGWLFTGPQIVYHNGTSGKIAALEFDGSSWVNVGSGGADIIGQQAAVVRLSRQPGKGHVIAHQATGSPTGGGVWYFDASNWVSVGSSYRVAGNLAGYSIINSGVTPDIWIAWSDQANGGRCRVSRYNGSSWSDCGLVSAGLVTWTSIVLGPDGYPRVAYADGGLADFVYVKRWTGSAWVGLAGAASTGAALTPVIGYDSAWTLYLLYRNTSMSGQIYFAKFVNND